MSKKTTKKKVSKRKSTRGRKPIITKEVLAKLEDAFSIGASDKEACVFAGIHAATLYRYQEKNPEFCERKELLREKPVLLARQVTVKGLRGNPELSLKFLERKRKKEFGLKQEVEHSGKVEHGVTAKAGLLQKLKDVIQSPDDSAATEQG